MRAAAGRYAWERAFALKTAGVRSRERALMQESAITKVINKAVTEAGPALITAAMFGTHLAMTGETLTVAQTCELGILSFVPPLPVFRARASARPLAWSRCVPNRYSFVPSLLVRPAVLLPSRNCADILT